MSKAPMTEAEDTAIRVAMAHMQGAEIRHLLVMDGPVLTGIVSNRDLGASSCATCAPRCSPSRCDPS